MDTTRILRLAALVAVLGTIIFIAYRVWPTPWEYDSRDGLVRIYRATGRVQRYTDDSGWVDYVARPNPLADLRRRLDSSGGR